MERLLDLVYFCCSELEMVFSDFVLPVLKRNMMLAFYCNKYCTVKVAPLPNIVLLLRTTNNKTVGRRETGLMCIRCFTCNESKKTLWQTIETRSSGAEEMASSSSQKGDLSIDLALLMSSCHPIHHAGGGWTVTSTGRLGYSTHRQTVRGQLLALAGPGSYWFWHKSFESSLFEEGILTVTTVTYQNS